MPMIQIVAPVAAGDDFEYNSEMVHVERVTRRQVTTMVYTDLVLEDGRAITVANQIELDYDFA